MINYKKQKKQTNKDDGFLKNKNCLPHDPEATEAGYRGKLSNGAPTPTRKKVKTQVVHKRRCLEDRQTATLKMKCDLSEQQPSSYKYIY